MEKGNRWNKDIKKENLKKDLLNLIETNYQVIMTFDISVSSNDSFRSLSNAKSLTCFQHCSSCAKHGDSASVSVARVI